MPFVNIDVVTTLVMIQYIWFVALKVAYELRSIFIKTTKHK